MGRGRKKNIASQVLTLQECFTKRILENYDLLRNCAASLTSRHTRLVPQAHLQQSPDGKNPLLSNTLHIHSVLRKRYITPHIDKHISIQRGESQRLQGNEAAHLFHTGRQSKQDLTVSAHYVKWVGSSTWRTSARCEGGEHKLCHHSQTMDQGSGRRLLSNKQDLTSSFSGSCGFRRKSCL